MTPEGDIRTRSPRARAAVLAVGLASAVPLTWAAAEGAVEALDRLGHQQPSVLGLVLAWPVLLLLATPPGRAALASLVGRRPVLVSGATLALAWAGCATLLVPETFPVAGAGLAHVVLQVRPRRSLLVVLLAALWAGTAAVVVGTAAGGLPSLVGAAVGDVLAVVLLLLVTGQVVSSAALARSAEASARHLAAQEEERVRELRHAAAHDPLTGALNRRGLFEQLQQTLTAPSCGTAVVFLDLDGFKAVNDSLGHEAGDELLVAVAQRLRTALRQPPRQADLLARLGGDEFVAVLAEVPSAEVAARVVERLRAAVTTPVTTSAGVVSVDVSAGTAHVGGRPDGPAACAAESLLRLADERMYREKRGRGSDGAQPQRSSALRPATSA